MNPYPPPELQKACIPGNRKSKVVNTDKINNNEYKCPHNIIFRAEDGSVRCEACGEEINIGSYCRRFSRSVLVEFLHKDHKVFDKTYWEDDKERYKDIEQWRSESPMKNVRYID